MLIFKLDFLGFYPTPTPKFWGRKIEKSTKLFKKSETCVERKLRRREAF